MKLAGARHAVPLRRCPQRCVIGLPECAAGWVSEPARSRQIHKEETHDAIFVIVFFVVQHSRIISVLQDNQFVRRRREPEQLGRRGGKRRFVRRFEIELSDAGKISDARRQGRHISILRLSQPKIICDIRVTSGIDPSPERLTCSATISFGSL